MEHYPNSHKEFLLWAEKISDRLALTTNGEVRIGKNKLAAIMAKELPNSPYGFNINTLKNLFELEPINTEQPRFSSLLVERMLKIFTGNFDFRKAFDERAKNNSATIYHLLDKEGEVGDFFSTLPVLSDQELSMVSAKLPAFYVEDVVDSLNGHKMSFNDKIKAAFNELTKDFLLVYLNSLSDFYSAHSILKEDSDVSEFSNRSYHALQVVNIENSDCWFSDTLSLLFKKALEHSFLTNKNTKTPC